MITENLAFLLRHHSASPYSTESESDDEDAVCAALSRRFSRSASLKEPLYEKRFFSGEPEWSGCGHSQGLWSPAFVKSDEDAWNMIYAAAAGKVARMKMMMSLSNGGAGGFYRQQEVRRYGCVSGSETVGGGCGGRPPSFPTTAWPPPPQQRLQRCNVPVVKPVVTGGSDGGGGGATAAKRECPGTGVFLPRRYCNNPPESRKRQACSPTNLPAKTIQPQAQSRINGGLVPHYEMLMGRRNAVIVAGQQRRSNTHGGVMESPVNNPEVLLPQEWTY